MTDLHHLSAAYALDALEAAESADFEAHLGQCERCRRDVAEFRSVAERLAVGASESPPPRLKGDVMALLDDVEQVVPVSGSPPVVDLAERRRRRTSVVRALGVAAAVALLAAGAIAVVGLRGGSEFDDVVAAPDAEVVELAGESGTVRVVWSPDRDQVALHGDGLADLDPDLRYALWAIADGTPTPAGLFDSDDGTIRAVADVDVVAAQAWGITIEPSTGSDTPTSDIIFFAET